MLETKIKKLQENLNKIPDEFWVKSENGYDVIWFLDQEDGTAGAYETSQERLGMTKGGEMIWGFSYGCSCWGGWNSSDYCPTKSLKEFSVSDDFIKGRATEYEWNDEKLTEWEKPLLSTLDSFLLLVSDNVDPKAVLTIENAEIRRYMIKRIGYENIKDAVDAKILHKDGANELLKFKSGELYVKVKDSSTEREYLLYVEGDHQTCKSAIAWTFGLVESEYNPVIES